VALPAGLVANAAPPRHAAVTTAARPSATHACTLGPGGAIKHVIYLQFDNTHFRRDDPNVPSDIEQMPALLHFMERNGTVLQDDHTPLIAHTADDMVTSLTGEYPDNQGIPEANSYLYYQPNGQTDEAGSFAYWRDPVDSYTTRSGLGIGDHTPNLIDAAGRMAPAPWVPFTRAGCDVGDVAMSNTELENALPDVPLVFGARSQDAKDAENPNYPTETEYEGLSVHCAQRSAFCARSSRPVPDRLPDEPGGYHGYQAVFGAKYLNPLLAKDGKPTSLYGKVITDGNGVVGFPGYDSMQPTNALAYTLDMIKQGIPVTYTYLTDVHDNAKTGRGMGPGEATYEQQLRQYNQGFAIFFHRLAAMGINPTNTLFVFGEDENDHFVGSGPTPPTCNGVTVTCTYSQVGEVDLNLQGLLAHEEGITTPFTVHADSAPFVYLPGQPGRTTPTVRNFGRALTRLTALDPYSGKTVPLTNYLADPVELQLLHMVTADPKRTPTFALFANPDFYLSADGRSCTTKYCESYDADAWNHGDISPDINQSWMAFVGPGVHNLGVSNLWCSETDTRPTMMAILHLRDDYSHQGDVLTPILDPADFNPALMSRSYTQVASAYTSIESPVGPFGYATLTASTNGIASDSAGDQTYQQTESSLASLGRQRDAVGAAMIRLLEAAAFDGRPIPTATATQLAAAADEILGRAEALSLGS
ncbi:MAG TPA: hypothetical protein VKV25_06900, partial [Acidimicrobiales bacterium]|nr:hypothetical protein [Acidimicrobiales bacterium]